VEDCELIEPVAPAALWLAELSEAPGVVEVAPVVLDCELGDAAALLCEAVASGVLVEGVLLAEGVLEADCEDCEPMVALAELLVWPLEDASGVAVLEALVLGVVLLELWLLISPEALDFGVELVLFGLVEELELLFGVVEASGVLLVPVVLLEVEELPTLLVELCELVLAEFGEVLELFGDVLELLSGVLLVEEELLG